MILEFKKIALSDRDLFEKHLEMTKYENSEYSFVSWYAWQDAYEMEYAMVEDCLCVIAQNDGVPYAYFPVGETQNVPKALAALADYFKERNQPLNLLAVSQKMLDTLEEIGVLCNFKLEERRDFADYVYLRETLVSLKGKKLQGKRNHLNFFLNHYSYQLLPITDENEPACEALVEALIDERSQNPGEELKATLRILRDRRRLGVAGSALYVDGTLAGVILGENRFGTVIVHIAKADIEYRGAAVALMKLFLEQFEDCERVNLMEDLGIEGLRKSKLAYSPIQLIDKNILTLKHQFVAKGKKQPQPSSALKCACC